LPGELAPRLALAMSAEHAGDFEAASRMYDLVSRTDPGFTSACFGLARCLMARGDRAAAIAALGRIPQTSSLYTRAQVEAARVLVVRNGTVPGLAELTGAAGALEGLSLEGMERHRLAQQVLETALYLVTSRAVKPDASVSILGRPLQEKPLRRGLEKSLRALARLSDGEEKIRLVDEANRVRPRTLF
jgi:serine/threonine-protein kinase PknG